MKKFFEHLVMSWHENKSFGNTNTNFLSNEDVTYILWHQDKWMDYVIGKFPDVGTFFKEFGEFLNSNYKITRHWELQKALAEFLIKQVLDSNIGN